MTIHRYYLRFMVFLFGILCLYTTSASAQSVDNINSTISVNHRSSPLRSQATLPGFNPCDSLTATSTNCDLASGALLSKANVDTTGLFGLTGPGSITDNMWGIVEDVSAAPWTCAPWVDGGAGPQAISVNTGELNCGDLRVDPYSQGLLDGGSIFALQAQNSLNHDINVKFNGDFSGTETPGASHTAFNFENLFHFDNSANDGKGFATPDIVPNTACTAAPIETVGACMKINQLTTIGASGGHGVSATEFPTALTGTPATGDQLFLMSVNWGNGGTNSAESITNSGLAGMPGGPFAENIPGATKVDVGALQTIKQPILPGASAGTFTLTAEQRFPINNANDGVLIPIPPSSLPTGESQTLSTGGTPTFPTSP